MKLKNGDTIYYIGTGDKVTFLRFLTDKDGQTRGEIQYDNGKVKKYHVSHFTTRPIFTKNNEEINNKNWLRISQQDDGVCWGRDCKVTTGHKKYCESCKADRKVYFKKKYYESKGWKYD